RLCLGDIGGIAECLELETGKTVWTERLKGSGGSGAVWSSPVLNLDQVHVINQSGDVFAFRAAPKFEQLSVSPLDEETNSSVVIADGSLFLRTYKALWCIR